MNKIKLINYFTYLAKNPNTNYKINEIQFSNLTEYFRRVLDILYDDVDYSTIAKLTYLTQYFCYEKITKVEVVQEEEQHNPFDESLCIVDAQKSSENLPGNILLGNSPAQSDSKSIDIDNSLAMSKADH